MKGTDLSLTAPVSPSKGITDVEDWRKKSGLSPVTYSNGSRSKSNQPIQKTIVLNPCLTVSVSGQAFKSWAPLQPC